MKRKHIEGSYVNNEIANCIRPRCFHDHPMCGYFYTH